MPRRNGMKLSEMLDVFHRYFEARKMQARIKPHGTVTCGKHDPIAIHPFRILRIVAKKYAIEVSAELCTTHRHPRMPRIGFLHSLNRELTDGHRRLTENFF